MELRRLRDYMPVTMEGITRARRAELVDWLVEVADDLVLPADTLHLAVLCVDRFLSERLVILSELRLLGVTALLVAAKYEDDTIFVHKVEYFIGFTEKAYTKQQMVKMEADILNLLNFEIGAPTARTFLRRYITVRPPPNHARAKKLEFLCSYLAELSLLDYDCTRSKPSVVAAACLFVGMFTTSPYARSWKPELQRSTGYQISDLQFCILRIHALQVAGRNMREKTIINKYSHWELESVSELVPPDVIYDYFLRDIEE
ncbi:unnamed protein product [Alopecurus aequalis]